MPRRKEPRIPVAVLDQLLAGADPKTVFDPNGLLDDLKKALAERVLNAALEEVYPLIFFDALRVKIRDEGLVRNKAVHIALGVRADGTKEILGLWLEQNEGAKFWLRVMNELKNRGVEDVLVAVVDGLKGFPDLLRWILA